MFFIGHSQILSPFNAARFRGVDADCFYLAQKSDHTIKLSIDDIVKNFPKGRLRMPVVFSILGFEHIWTISSSHRFFDFLYGKDDLCPVAEVVPLELIRSFIKELMYSFHFFDYLETAVRLVREIGSFPLYYLSPPPPVVWKDARQYDLKTCYKVWSIANEIRKECCASLGLTFIDPPPQTVDNLGFMLPKLVADHVHGNDLYGLFVIRDLKERGIL
jgi:hypothetical protein